MADENIFKNRWDHFVLEQNGSFLQSWERGEFQKFVGREVNFLKNENLQALVVKHNLPFGKSYLYCPRGPIASLKLKINPSASGEKVKIIEEFKKETEKVTRENGVIFVRIEPSFEIGESDLKELGFVKSRDVQPSKTLVLDLGASEEELLAKMHEKTRYNIRLAEKKGVTVRVAQYNENDFETFWKLVSLTAKRQKIRIFPKEYYRKQFQINLPQSSFTKEGEEKDSSLSQREGRRDFMNLLFIAEHQSKTIAANLVNFFGETATYLHGGWDKDHRSLMAPHLLQWKQIKEARNRGCELYDFWGIDEQKWPGVTRFKKSFGGRQINYIGCWDYPIDKKWYFLYRLIQGLRR